MSDKSLDHSGMSRRNFLQATGAVPLAGLLNASDASSAVGVANQMPTNTSTPAQVTLTVNGQTHTLMLDPRRTLLDLLREQLGLTGSKKGCDHGQCGACTVLIGERRVLSCLTLAAAVREPVTTIEGLANDGHCMRCNRRSSIKMHFNAATAHPVKSSLRWPASKRAMPTAPNKYVNS